MDFPECYECGATLIPELMVCPKCGAEADHEIPTELRCECGFLLCKLAEEAIEIKCRRCKRLVYIPAEDIGARFEKNKERAEERYQKRSSYSRSRDGGGYDRPRQSYDAPSRGQYCSGCGKVKQNVVYGKCLDCRTESIKIQYKGRNQ